MSKRKTRKEKIRAQERLEKIRKVQQEINLLKEKIMEQEQIKRKECWKRNFKAVGHTCNLLIPFVITAGLTLGGFKLFAGGLPFVKDEINKYKKYNLEYSTEEGLEGNAHYVTNYWFSDALPENTLEIISQWQLTEEGLYKRNVKSYSISKEKILELYNALLEQDIEYLTNVDFECEEKIEEANVIFQEYDGYLINASLNFFDKDDKLTYEESDMKNIIITICELLVAIGIGVFFACIRDFEYFYEMRYINSGYNDVVRRLNNYQQQLEEKELTLSLKKGNNDNVR